MKAPKQPAGFGLEFKITDECGEGAFLEIVICEKVGDWTPPILFARFPEPPAIGSRFTYRGIVWELTKETESYEDLWIKGKNATWEARPAAARQSDPLGPEDRTVS